MAETRVQTVPEFQKSTEEQVRLLAQRVNGLLVGYGNFHYDVTLDADVSSTVRRGPRFKSASVVLLSPQSASAAAATGVWAEAGDGLIRIHHDVSSATDRRFAVTVFG